MTRVTKTMTTTSSNLEVPISPSRHHSWVWYVRMKEKQEASVTVACHGVSVVVGLWLSLRQFEYVFPLLQPCLLENMFGRVVFPVKLSRQTQAFVSLSEELCLCLTLGLSGGGQGVGPLKKKGSRHQIRHILTQIRSNTTAWSAALSFEL